MCRREHVYYPIFPHILQVFKARPNLNSSEDRLTFLRSNPVTELEKINQVVEKSFDKERVTKKH